MISVMLAIPYVIMLSRIAHRSINTLHKIDFGYSIDIFLTFPIKLSILIYWSIGQDTSPCTPPPLLQVDQNFLTQKIFADPKMRCHQNSFGIWRVTALGNFRSKTVGFFQKTYFGKNS